MENASSVTYHSNAKLLITAEYLVLEGADALALPLKYRQSLKVTPIDTRVLYWKSIDETRNTWFEANYKLGDKIEELSTTDKEISKVLQSVLLETQGLNPSFLISNGFEATTFIDFPKKWGLGTSSTLINNIAQWANIDAFELQHRTFAGSGYDIACAQASRPLIFSNKPRRIELITLDWDFKEELFFVYLNKKQSSEEAIRHYKNFGNHVAYLPEINKLTHAFIACDSLKNLENLIQEHEKLIAEVISLPTVKQQFFADYPGAVKSLGAWGGDFILATRKDALTYFPQKGYPVVMPFERFVT